MHKVRKFKLTLSNSAGPLDSEILQITVDDDLAVTETVMRWIRTTPLGHGDTITIEEVDND